MKGWLAAKEHKEHNRTLLWAMWSFVAKSRCSWYAVLTAVASVGVAMLVTLVWFAVALVFRRRFQFSIRSLVVVVALPCSWSAAEMKTADRQQVAKTALQRFPGYAL